MKGIFPARVRGFRAGCQPIRGVGVSPSSSAYRFATLSDAGMEWRLRRNCSVTPAQLGLLYASLCVVSLGVAGFFWAHGATLVLPFAVLEILAVGIAFLVYARHAADGERVRLMGRALLVEQEVAGRLVCREFAREWVRVAPQEKAPNLIEVRGGGESVHIGRYLRPDLRPALAREISQALRGG
ncbi:DUF2244 domain-containing protein [Hydrogenophaga sp. T2]|uniref:DUF2244 domain-containing protein n=1 Tax=Hydrogenophaga sp. T2 TaxID=3132823 RepID=UPI003CEDD955